MENDRPKLHLVPQQEKPDQNTEPFFEQGRPFRFEDISFSLPNNQLTTPDQKAADQQEHIKSVVSLEELRDRKMNQKLAEIVNETLGENTLTRQTKGAITINNETLPFVAVCHTQYEDTPTTSKPVSAVYKFWFNNDPTFEYYASFELDPNREPDVLVGEPTLTGEHDDWRISFFPKFLNFIQTKAQEFNRPFKSTVDLTDLPEAFRRALLASGRYHAIKDTEGNYVLQTVYKPLSRI